MSTLTTDKKIDLLRSEVAALRVEISRVIDALEAKKMRMHGAELATLKAHDPTWT
jgi:hypothetical protein